MKPEKRVLGACKGVTEGKTQGAAYRLAETMAEAHVESQRLDGKNYEVMTHAKLRIFEDGSGLFQFTRGKETMSLRWSEEGEAHSSVYIAIGDETPKMLALSGDFPIGRPA